MRISSVKFLAATVLLTSALAVPAANGDQVVLENGTGTFSQEGFRSPAQSADGYFDHFDPLGYLPDPIVWDDSWGNGWAILSSPNGDETAVWETRDNLVPPSGSESTLTFTMHFDHNWKEHILGRFRISVTTDDRSEFADGLSTGGDVTANWVVLTEPTVTLPSGMTYTVLEDGSILTAGAVPNPQADDSPTGFAPNTYTVSFATPISGITGIRLEALEHSSLPSNGPGMFVNGNFQLTELTLDYTGEQVVSDPVMLLEALILDVAGVNYAQGINNAVDAKLDAIFAALTDANDKNDIAACHAMDAFVIYVEAQWGASRLTGEQAVYLIDAAEDVAELLCAL